MVGTMALSVPAQAGLTLTAEGIADGFTLSNFLSGGAGYTFLGSANLPDGTLAVGGFASGQIFKFNDVDGQTLANSLLSVSFPGEIDLATAGGKAYAASRNLGLFEVGNNLSLTPVTINPPALPTQGLAGNPVNGHLVAVSSSGMIDIDPTTGNSTFIANPSGGLADGVSVSSDGKTAYVAMFGGAAVLGFDIATGTQVFSATGLPGGPDGTAVIVGGTFDGDIVVNNNDGSVGLIDKDTALETIIATGGTRGDFVGPDLKNGSLLLFEDSDVWRLAISGGSIGGPPPTTPDTGSSLSLLACGLGAIGLMRRSKKS